jgi:hypothetical protein
VTCCPSSARAWQAHEDGADASATRSPGGRRAGAEAAGRASAGSPSSVSTPSEMRPKRRCASVTKTYRELSDSEYFDAASRPDSGVHTPEALPGCRLTALGRRLTSAPVVQLQELVIVDSVEVRRQSTGKSERERACECAGTWGRAIETHGTVTSLGLQRRNINTSSQVTVTMANMLMQLRKVCNHPYLIEYPLTPAVWKGGNGACTDCLCGPRAPGTAHGLGRIPHG